MLQQKLEHLNSMGVNELMLFEKQVIESLLTNCEKDGILELIRSHKELKNKNSAIIELSEGIDFD